MALVEGEWDVDEVAALPTAISARAALTELQRAAMSVERLGGDKATYEESHAAALAYLAANRAAWEPQEIGVKPVDERGDEPIVIDPRVGGTR
jgi:hypothetical protein